MTTGYHEDLKIMKNLNCHFDPDFNRERNLYSDYKQKKDLNLINPAIYGGNTKEKKLLGFSPHFNKC